MSRWLSGHFIAPFGFRAAVYFPTALVVLLVVTAVGVSVALAALIALVCGVVVLEIADRLWDQRHPEE